jgi:DNA-directed RNA polymerase sigma subunit (sigma70/sigma32)
MPLRKEVWAADYLATDAEGEVLSPDALRGAGRTPEQIVSLKQLAGQLEDRLHGRDGDIYRRRLETEETYAGGVRWGGVSGASIGLEMNLSRERVRQIVKQVEGELRAWGAEIEKEAA